MGTELEDILAIWVDGAAEAIAITQISPGPCSLNSPSTNMWTTNVEVRHPDGGPTPDTASYIYKLEREKESRERGDTKDNRSFIAKYVIIFFFPKKYKNNNFILLIFIFSFLLQWMYIVPALIFVVLTSAANPDGAGGGNGGGQRQ